VEAFAHPTRLLDNIIICGNSSYLVELLLELCLVSKEGFYNSVCEKIQLHESNCFKPSILA
jgi:hypothetical protein